MQAKSLIRRKQCMHFFYNNSPTMRSSGVIVCNSLKCYLNCKIINAQLAAGACTLFFLYSLDLASLADRLSVDRHRPVNWEHAPLSLPPTVLSFEKNVIDRVKLANHLQLCGGRVPECNVYIMQSTNRSGAEGAWQPFGGKRQNNLLSSWPGGFLGQRRRQW